MTNETDTGHLRPDGDLADVFRPVVRDMLDDEHGAVKSGTNKALIDFLERAPEEVVQYHLGRKGYASLDELKRSVRSRQSAPYPGESDDD
jgi:hypothetical protein